MARILLLNQCFYPDHVSTAQHLADLAQGLREAGHEVWVVAARRAYDKPDVQFPSMEVWNGVQISRIASLGLGKKSILRRIIDSISFWLSAAFKVFTVPRPDVVVCLTSPPMISTLGGLVSWARRARLVHWVMDLNPDEAVAAGLIRPGSLTERVLGFLLERSFRQASLIVALDRFMEERLKRKAISSNVVFTAPPWSHDEAIHFDPDARAAFRSKHGLDDKFVIMYSGNHSPCHPLQTVLDAAHALAADTRFHFVFIGGGSGFPRAKAFAESHELTNFLFLPYQPLDAVAGSLSSADLHVVAMGDAFVGVVHPCKIYNILHLGIPFLFIGPMESHLGDLMRRLPDPMLGQGVAHGDVGGAIRAIKNSQAAQTQLPAKPLQELSAEFTAGRLRTELVSEISQVANLR